MRDFICKRNGTYDYSTTGIGWTLHDSSYAVDEDNPAINDWFVIYSAGESGDEDLYFRFLWMSGYVRIHGFQSWDSSTHAGAIQYSTSNTAWTFAETMVPHLWVYGDLDAIAIPINESGDTYARVADFGKADKPWEALDDEVATCSSTLAAGSDVSITVDAIPAGWAVGRELYIRTTHNNNTATVEIEKITIKTLVSLTITADLSNSYTANSKLSDHVGYHCTKSYSIGISNALISPNGVTSSGATSVSYDKTVASTANDPGSYESSWGMAELGLGISTGFFGKYRNIYRIALGALTLYDILEEVDGTQWRYIKVYSNTHYVFKEV